ncbi:MAG: hypothetical protein IT430_07000 [Phycisphaerales bacterium]|nr:hypothetical protein [Phycisphaerales bacterium]
MGAVMCLAAPAWPQSSPLAAADRDESVRLLIIAPEELREALAEFAAFKRDRLGSVDLIPLDDALSRGAAEALQYPDETIDDPARLKHFLYGQWKGEGITHVLLVGDADVLPVRYMVLDRITAPAFDYAFYPSDLYYADLARRDGSFDDWNSRKDDFHSRYFGEVRGEKNKDDPINFDDVDYRPEIALGRWPVSTADEARAVADKSMRHEAALEAQQDDAAPEAALIAVGGWVDARGNLDQTAARLQPHWAIERRYYRDAGSAADAPAPPDEAQLLDLINSGVDLIIHAGHGSDNVWEQCLSVATLEKIEPRDRLPVMFSVGCSTARFATLPPYEAYADLDLAEHAGTNGGEAFTAPPPPPSPYATGRFNHTGLGESFLRSTDRGCVAYIGCNTGSQPCALTLLDGFSAEMARKREDGSLVRIGDCWTAAISHYYEAENLATIQPDEGWYPASIFFQGMKFMLLGDPTLPMGR